MYIYKEFKRNLKGNEIVRRGKIRCRPGFQKVLNLITVTEVNGNYEFRMYIKQILPFFFFAIIWKAPVYIISVCCQIAYL